MICLTSFGDKSVEISKSFVIKMDILFEYNFSSISCNNAQKSVIYKDFSYNINLALYMKYSIIISCLHQSRKWLYSIHIKLYNYERYLTFFQKKRYLHYYLPYMIQSLVNSRLL